MGVIKDLKQKQKDVKEYNTKNAEEYKRKHDEHKAKKK